MTAKPDIVWEHHRGWSTTKLLLAGRVITAEVAASMVEGQTWRVECDGQRVDGGNDYTGGFAFAYAEATIRRLVREKRLTNAT